MNELKIFAYSGEELRTIQREDGLWWVLRDVCRVLGITNHKMVAQRLDEDEVSLADLIDALGRTQKTGPVRSHPAVGQAGGQSIQTVGDARCIAHDSQNGNLRRIAETA